MYQFRPVSERIARTRDRIRNRVIQLDSERAMIVTDAFKDCINLVPTIRRPTLLKAVTSKVTLRVEDDDVLVGNRGRYFSSSVAYPENNEGVGWIVSAIRERVNGRWRRTACGITPRRMTRGLRRRPRMWRPLRASRISGRTKPLTPSGTAGLPPGSTSCAAWAQRSTPSS